MKKNLYLINIIILMLLLSCMIALFTGTIAKIIYNQGKTKKIVRGYVVDTSSIGIEPSQSSDGEQSMLELLKQADANKGEKIFARCASCHTYNKNGKNKIGPNLWNVVGKQIATTKGFKYSNILQKYSQEKRKWNEEELAKFIYATKTYAPGTKMTFNLKNKYQIADVITFLKTQKD